MVRHSAAKTHAAPAAVVAAPFDGNGNDSVKAKTIVVPSTDKAQASTQLVPVPTSAKSNVNIAESKLGSNDPFSAYADVDTDKLQDAAIKALHEQSEQGRREGQLQTANILARYAQDKLAGDANPANLYITEQGETKLNPTCLQAITRSIYGFKEGDKFDRKYEARVRVIAPLVHFAITQRIPLLWNERKRALMVPTWMLTTTKEQLQECILNPAEREGRTGLDALTGAAGYTIAALTKRLPNPAAKPKGADDKSAQSDDETSARNALKKIGLARVLALVVESLAAADNKPFADDIVEHVQVACEHVAMRNGKDALGKAAASLLGKRQKKSA